MVINFKIKYDEFVKAGNTIGSWTAVCANGGKVTINDGNYTVGLNNGNSNSCVYVKNGGQVTINGGEYSHEIPASGNNYGMPLQIEDNDTEGKITVNGGVFVLDNGRYYEEKDKAQITFTATETINNGKAIISGAFGKTIIIENTQLSDALYKLYGDVYYNHQFERLCRNARIGSFRHQITGFRFLYV